MTQVSDPGPSWPSCLMEKLGNRMQKKNQTDWLQKPQFHWLRYDDAKKIDDVQFLYTAKEN